MLAKGSLQQHEVRNVALESGEVLPLVTTAYATLGSLNEERSNAVLVLHGYTTGPGMLFPGSNAAEGSWSGLIGPGRAIDTERFFAICPNMLGSSYGSTGPASINPSTGRPYGMEFPHITLGDVVDAQCRLIDSLGIHQLAAVAGPSLGAMQAFLWATRYPERVGRVIAAVGAPYCPEGVVDAQGLLQSLAQEPRWQNGLYKKGALAPWLTRLRLQTLERYGIEAELRSRFRDENERMRELNRIAAEWAEAFDPGSLVILARAVEEFDVRGELQRMRAPLLYVLSRSDEMFTPKLIDALSPLLDAAGVKWRYVELESAKGHLASGADSDLWADTLRDFLTTPTKPTSKAGFACNLRGRQAGKSR